MRLLNRIATALTLLALAAVLLSFMVAKSSAQAPERRFALVIGNSEYKAGQLPTAANDAGLVAETLRGAGFDVTGARDLDQDTLRRSVRDFLDKVSAAGPEAVSFVYLAGYGVQFDGENYLVPVDANLRRDEDIPIEAFRISDFLRPLSGLPGTVKIVVIDAARQHPFTPAGLPLASGLALVDPDPNMAIAFNATPGSIAPIESGPYGAFAQSLAEMIATGGLGLDDLFARVRLRVNEKTNGVAVPWYASKITRPFLFTDPAPGAPPPPQAMASAELRTRAIGDFRTDEDAYAAAMERDDLAGYEDFLASYPNSPLAVRVRAIIAVRREAITWRRTFSINSREAYWSYLRRYPEGAHVADAQRRLARLAAEFDPPPAFVPLAYDVGPPPPDEVVYLSQPYVVFDGPGFYAPPPIPVLFLPPPPPFFVVLEPPPPPIGPFFLSAPVVPFAAIGVGVGVGIGVGLFARPPSFVVPPPRPPVQRININNTTIINNITNNNAAPGAGAARAASLPPSLVTRVNSGALKAPPPAAPPPRALTQTAALPGAATLGKPTPPPPPPKPLTPTTAAVTPGTPPPGPPRALGPNIATPGTPGGTPGALLPGATPPGPLRPPAPATATTTPGTLPGATPPGPLRPPAPATATTTPGTLPGATPPGPLRPPAPATATTTPRTPPGATPPGPLRPPSPATATTTPRALPGAIPPGPPRPPAPATATATPGTPPNVGRTPPGPNAAPPPPVVNRPPPPPAVASRPPPPPVVNRPPPPPTVTRPPPPVVNRPPPPPAVASRPPPPAVVNRPPPPVASRPPPPAAAAKKCTVVNGQQVCK